MSRCVPEEVERLASQIPPRHLTKPSALVVPRIAILVLLGVIGSPAVRSCTVFELSDSGFAANAVHLLHVEPIFGGGNNGTLFVDSSRFAYKCSDSGGWHDFFDVGTDVLVPWSSAREAAEGRGPCRRLDFAGIDRVLHHSFHLPWYSVDFMGAHKLWRMQNWVQKKVDKKLRALKEYPRPTIGFHIRGGDKGEEDILKKRKSTEAVDYINAAKRAWPRLKGGTCVLVGDDRKKMAEAEELAKHNIGCQVYRSSIYYRRDGHLQYDFNAQSYEQRCKGTVAFLTDIELLARTDFAVLSFNSGLAHLVDVLRVALYKKPRWTFVDASDARLDWWEGIRKHYMARATKHRPSLPQVVSKRQQDAWKLSTQHEQQSR